MLYAITNSHTRQCYLRQSLAWLSRGFTSKKNQCIYYASVLGMRTAVASNANPLQGSLFGDSKATNFEIKTSQKHNLDSNRNFSEKELTTDAELRPRKRKTTKANRIRNK